MVVSENHEMGQLIRTCKCSAVAQRVKGLMGLMLERDGKPAQVEIKPANVFEYPEAAQAWRLALDKGGDCSIRHG